MVDQAFYDALTLCGARHGAEALRQLQTLLRAGRFDEVTQEIAKLGLSVTVEDLREADSDRRALLSSAIEFIEGMEDDEPE